MCAVFHTKTLTLCFIRVYICTLLVYMFNPVKCIAEMLQNIQHVEEKLWLDVK